MKRVGLVGFALVAALIAMGCGGRNSAGSGSAGAGSGKIEGEITVSAYESWNYRNFLEEAAKVFEAVYPRTSVKVEVFSAMPEVRTGGTGDNQMMMVRVQNDPQSRADYVSRVNTGLMSGGGADLFAMDILPLHKFVQNNVLENLDTYMEADPGFNRGDYRQNILSALNYKGGTWFLPLDYSFNYYAYDASLVPAQAAQIAAQIAAQFGPDKAWNTGELFKLGESWYDGKHRLLNTTVTGLGFRLLDEQMEHFADLENRKANFLDGGFTGLLESLKQYEERGYIPPEVSRQGEAGRMLRAAAAEEDRYYFKANGNFSLYDQFTRGTGIKMMIRREGSAGGITDDDEIAGIAAAAADGSVPFTYSKAFGINSRSKNKALAWAFLKFLLSEEMELSTSHDAGSLPLHNGARAEKAELLFTGAFMGRGGQPLNDQLRQRMEQYRGVVETMSDSINHFAITDSAVSDMITTETRLFLGGSRSVEETAKVLQNKVDLYLNE
ncbi:ABC transporter substrate-binding protein [Spirochaetia bacterium]|nr:ABC transporter substrate-binding protein [Spirochaetia bacterium]